MLSTAPSIRVRALASFLFPSDLPILTNSKAKSKVNELTGHEEKKEEPKGLVEKASDELNNLVHKVEGQTEKLLNADDEKDSTKAKGTPSVSDASAPFDSVNAAKDAQAKAKEETAKAKAEAD